MRYYSFIFQRIQKTRRCQKQQLKLWFPCFSDAADDTRDQDGDDGDDEDNQDNPKTLYPDS